MAKISRHALMPYSAQQMYDIVNAVDRYQEFLPWCARSEILHQDDRSMKARVLMKKGKLNHSFTTRNDLADGERIGMNLVDGPFKRLQGEWVFIALGEGQSKIELKLEFEFSNRVIALLIGPLFTQIANTLVDAFSQRAHQIYRAKT
jgi:ribosome-associated toxin RatA of RatAB toxin-antitoxin module